MKLMAAFLLFVPALTFGDDLDWDMFRVRDEITDLKRRVEIAEEEIKTLKLDWDMFSAKPDSKACPCPQGGKCICPADACPCPNCPEHKKQTTDSPWRGYQPTFRGREVLYFGADWCKSCPEAETRLGNYKSAIYKIDCTDENPIADRYSVSSLPTMIAIDDGREAERTSGNSVGTYFAKKWLSGETTRKTSKIAPVRRIPPKDDFQPVRISRTSPAYSYAQAGYNPVQRCTVNRLSGTRWTWPGDLGNHLRQAHGFNPAGFSHSQLVTIHDNFHNTGQSGVSSGGYRPAPMMRTMPAQRTFQPRVMFSGGGSFCPTCPR